MAAAAAGCGWAAARNCPESLFLMLASRAFAAMNWPDSPTFGTGGAAAAAATGRAGRGGCAGAAAATGAAGTAAAGRRRRRAPPVDAGISKPFGGSPS